MAFPNPYLDDCADIVSSIAKRGPWHYSLQRVFSKIGSDAGINPVTTGLRRMIFGQAARGDNSKFDIFDASQQTKMKEGVTPDFYFHDRQEEEHYVYDITTSAYTYCLYPQDGKHVVAEGVDHVGLTSKSQTKSTRIIYTTVTFCASARIRVNL